MLKKLLTITNPIHMLILENLVCFLSSVDMVYPVTQTFHWVGKSKNIL